MNTITIPYPPIHIGTEKTSIFFYDSFESFIAKENNTSTRKIYVVDDTVCNLHPVKSILESIDSDSIVVTIQAGETYKTIDTVLKIVSEALEADMQRSSTFIGIGGGVVCDMTAFAASIFKRGAKLELIPTTLLAMVDASIGGKTGVDFSNYKNMIGSFYPASSIHMASEFVQSQSKKEYLSGLAEVVKTAMLYDTELFNIMKEKKDAILARDKDVVKDMIYRCAKAKACVVEQDLTEKNIRMQLNLGHTFGHALESIAGLGSITHGEAVAWGIARAIDLSEKMGLCSNDYKNDIFSVLESYGWCTNAIHPCLTINKDEVPTALLQAMKKDKKNSSSKVRVILQKDLCNTQIQEVEDDILIPSLQ